MMRALFAGVSGLRSHQTKMDVIGNNIANVNTVGFKASRVTFKEAFVQLIRGASRPGTLGGTNPVQIGTGVNVGSIDQLFTQGSLETTGLPLDMAIQGNSLFVLSDGGRQLYSRAGDFRLDASGRLTSGSGLAVQGINADAQGNFSSSSSIGDIVIRTDQRSPAQQTSQLTLAGNLDTGAAVGDTHSMSITAYDSAGARHDLQLVFTNTGPGTWDWNATSATGAVTPATPGTVAFNPNGSLASFTHPGGANFTFTPTGGTAIAMTVNSGTVAGFDGLTGFANPSNAVVNSQNGYASGDLTNISVDSTGMITGYFSNGVSRSLSQVALATFNNPAGLLSSGDGAFLESPNSGLAVIGFAGTTNPSSITAGALESSNVDISQEFTNMIIAQRGFQANARVISTADDMLQELVNIRR